MRCTDSGTWKSRKDYVGSLVNVDRDLKLLMAQKYTKFAKVNSKFCQLVNKPTKNCPWLWGFCQSGENFAKSGYTARHQNVSLTCLY